MDKLKISKETLYSRLRSGWNFQNFAKEDKNGIR